MFRHARTRRGGLRGLLPASLAAACLLPLCAARAQTQTPTPGANSNGAPAASANTNGNTNVNANVNAVGVNTNASGNVNAGASPAPAASPGVTPGAAAKKKGAAEESLARRWFGIEAPFWALLLIVALLLALAIVALKYVPWVRATLGPDAPQTTRWTILVIILLLVVFFLGRWFGHNEEPPGVRSATPNASPSPAVGVAAVPAGEVARTSPTQQPPRPLAQTPAQTPAPTPAQTPARPGATPAPAAAAQTPTPAPTPTPSPTPAPTPYEITVGAVTRPDADEPPDGDEAVVAGLGDEIVVKVNNLGGEVRRQELVKEPAATRLDPRRLVLFLDDVEMKKLYPEAIDLTADEVRFKLLRDDDTSDAWDDLLAKPEEPYRPVKVGVGPEGKTAWPQVSAAAQNFLLRVYSPFRLKLNAVLFLIALALFLWLAGSSNIIRDSQPSHPEPGTMRPYSLSRTQVAWWFFIIFGSFLFLWVVTGDYNVFTTSSLVLLGIGTGTALGSAMVDASKRDSVQSELRTLKPRQAKLVGDILDLKNTLKDLEERAAAGEATPEQLAAAGGQRSALAAKEAELELLNEQVADAESARSKPVSEGFIRDVLSDVNGVTFHRFQNAVWTIALGVIFIKSVWSGLKMPQYDDIVLALMGISGATYLGFKFPERQTEPTQQPQPAQPGAGAQAGAAGAGGAAGAAGAAGANDAAAVQADDFAPADGEGQAMGAADASGEAAAGEAVAEEGAAGADEAAAVADDASVGADDASAADAGAGDASAEDAGAVQADDYAPEEEEGK